MEEKFTETLIWNGIEIKISCIFEWPINTFCHIELRAKERLPVTQTGYRSHFMLMEHLNGYESHINFVKDWLDDAALSKDWQKHVEDSKQMSFFE